MHIMTGWAFSLLAGAYVGASARNREWFDMLEAGLLLIIGWLMGF